MIAWSWTKTGVNGGFVFGCVYDLTADKCECCETDTQKRSLIFSLSIPRLGAGLAQAV
jgi:hypothetical protein